MPRRLQSSDPTRTTHLQRAFANEIARRQSRLKEVIVDRIQTRNRYDFPSEDHPTKNTDYQFATDASKIKDFSNWLQSQLDSGVLGLVGSTDPDEPVGAQYIASAYKQGIVRAYLESHKDDLVKDPAFYGKSEAAYLQDSFGGPEGLDKVQALYTRAFEEMKGFTAKEKQILGRVLADGMANGLGASQIARNMTDNIDDLTRVDATRIARTEIVRAHAEGTLDTYEDLGIDELGLEAEWSTADDDAVCEDCQDATDSGPYSVDEARGLIPLHPNCRCAWIPVRAEARSSRKQDAIDRIREAAMRGDTVSEEDNSGDKETTDDLEIEVTPDE